MEKEAYEKIFSSEHVLFGRVAKLEPFIQNTKVRTMKELDVNKRKICVLGIPLHLSDQDIIKIFNGYGPVEAAYIRRSGGGTKNNHGFVTFKHHRVAKQMRELKFLRIKGGFKLKICEVSNKKKGNEEENGSLMEKNSIKQGGNSRDFDNFERSRKNWDQSSNFANDPNNKFYNGQPPIYPGMAQSNFLREINPNFISTFNQNHISHEENEHFSHNPEEQTEDSRFFDEEFLKSLTEKIKKNNDRVPEIISPNMIQEFLLFYQNAQERKIFEKRNSRLNYSSITKRFSRILEKNHLIGNVRLNRGGYKKWKKSKLFKKKSSQY